ncbi:hypothetical protein B0A50_03915 [Salinomyces thailandicus]|uniref:F-box domain-containing protein n=1 Tax=Salinomyces thailandicus TaxID=706561 RepID=A0A4U0U0W2_9PEZI|nr:hypothetical protein B0A50_03915 [Salinomyces thailandica]
MPTLLDLPIELIDDIAVWTAPEGIEGFLLSCKAVYDIGKGHIARHNRYKRRWKRFSHVHVGDLDERDKLWKRPRTVLQLIREIALDPCIALYINDLNLYVPKCLSLSSQKIVKREYNQLRDNGNAMAAIQSLLARSRHLKKAAQDPDLWLRRIQLDDQYPGDLGTLFPAAFLLTLLPNVQKLVLPRDWRSLPHPLRPDREYVPRPCLVHERSEIRRLMDIIVGEAHEPNRTDAALAKLECVLPNGWEGSLFFNDGRVLQEVDIFMAMPSIKQLYTYNGNAWNDGWNCTSFRAQYPVASNLRRAEFLTAYMSADSIAELLTHAPLITCLKYSHMPPNSLSSSQTYCRAGDFVTAVGKHIGRTLKEFSMTIKPLGNCIIERGVVSMQEFTALEKAELDVQIFCGRLPEPGEMADLSTDRFWLYEQIPCVPDIFPPSIKSLMLWTRHRDLELWHHNVQGLRRLFSHTSEKQSARLPALEHLAVGFICHHEGREAEEDEHLRELKHIVNDLCTAEIQHYDIFAKDKDEYARRFPYLSYDLD